MCLSMVNFAISYSVQPLTHAAGYDWPFFFFFDMCVLASIAAAALLVVMAIKPANVWVYTGVLTLARGGSASHQIEAEVEVTRSVLVLGKRDVGKETDVRAGNYRK
ncbi:hypothetical protein GGR56DRAFT_617782 [Xylariaceae sp. FL0804]|nr:hypothetical protein GGR56DRAFT_617782 [Xylariaceae sp. FL0804]